MFDRIKKIPPLTVVTAELILLSAGAFLAVHLMGKGTAEEQPEAPAPASISAELVDSANGAPVALTETGSIDRLRGVRITEGEGYVRFHVDMLDSDGTPLRERLTQKEEEIEVFKGYTSDPDMPSYEAFNDKYHELQNEYEEIKLKADAAMAAFLRSDDGSLLNNEELIRVDDADGCGCTLTCREKLSEGDVAELYSSIAMPGDDAVDTTYKAYRKNEDNSYSSVDLEAGTAWILGSGFGIHVTAEAVSSQGLDNAFAAFLLAE